ncbi:MAG: hypothetical protein RL011_1764 [Pseudomonadota bacterium]
MSMLLNQLNKLMVPLAILGVVATAGCENPKDQEGERPTLNLAPLVPDRVCPELLFDFATVGVPEYDLLYTYVAIAGSTVGTGDNINRFEGSTLRVQPRSCSSFPSGTMVINAVQVAKVDKDTGRITAEVIFLADPESGYYKAKADQTRIPVYPVKFVYPESLLDAAIPETDKAIVGAVISQGCQFNQVDGFTPCKPADPSFAALDQFYRGLEAIESHVVGAKYFEDKQILARKITPAVGALKGEVAAMAVYKDTVAPYQARLDELSAVSGKSFAKSRFVPWLEAAPVVDYLHRELIGHEGRLAKLKGLGEAAVVIVPVSSAVEADGSVLSLEATLEKASEFVRSLD